MTYSEIILRVVNEFEGWVVSHQLEKVSTPWGWIGTRGIRTCRDLENMGLLEKSLEVNKPYVSYKITQKGQEALSKADTDKVVEAVPRNRITTVSTPMLHLRTTTTGWGESPTRTFHPKKHGGSIPEVRLTQSKDSMLPVQHSLGWERRGILPTDGNGNGAGTCRPTIQRQDENRQINGSLAQSHK